MSDRRIIRMTGRGVAFRKRLNFNARSGYKARTIPVPATVFGESEIGSGQGSLCCDCTGKSPPNKASGPFHPYKPK